MKIKFTILLAILFCSTPLFAQDKKDDKKKEKKEKSILDLTKSSKKIEGLFTIYQDTISGKLKMVVSKNQFENEFIHFSQIADGVT